MNLGRETERVEFKKSTAEFKEGMASLAAILTKHGSGTLYFGVKNNGEDGPQTSQDGAAECLSSYDAAIVAALAGGPLGRGDLLAALGPSDGKNLRERYIVPALRNGLIELEIPGKPKSKSQRYRLTARGDAALRSWEG